MNNLALLVKQRSGSNSPIAHIAYDQAYEPGFEDMPRRVPALEKLVGLTGFRPSTSLNEIVDGVIAYFRDRQETGMAKSVTAGAAEGRAAAGLSAD
jgi:UDP-glucose 4-epimerase